MAPDKSNASNSPQTSQLWTVMRQDDPGNQFVVCEHLSRDEAERIAAEFQARGHKQLYWAQPESG